MRLNNFTAVNDWLSLITISVLEKTCSLNPRHHIPNVDRNIAKHLSKDTSYIICNKSDPNLNVRLINSAAPLIATAFNRFMNNQPVLNKAAKLPRESNNKHDFIKRKPKL